MITCRRVEKRVQGPDNPHVLLEQVGRAAEVICSHAEGFASVIKR
jgi:hypothetical protein